jgi:hypothetical protein
MALVSSTDLKPVTHVYSMDRPPPRNILSYTQNQGGYFVNVLHKPDKFRELPANELNMV